MLRVLLVALAIATPCTLFAQDESIEDARAFDVKDFIHDQAGFAGDGWLIEKYRDEETQQWRARLVVDESIIHDFGDCGQTEDWMRFFVWDGHGDAHNLLFVLRFAGGEHGLEYLDVVDLEDDYRLLFTTTDDMNFQRIEDLDADGWPEIVALSRSFDTICGISDIDNPRPTLVFSRPAEHKRYECANHRYPGMSEEQIGIFRDAFDRSSSVDGRLAYDPNSEGTIEPAFALLLRWAIELSYRGQNEDAWELLKQHLEPQASKLVRAAVEERLNGDRYYLEMKRIQNEEAKTPKVTRKTEPTAKG